MITASREITIRGIILGIILAMILAASNTYLALKIGILTSASIPAAIISMGILRFFKHSTILENNLIQTTASAGEAIAGGIVYTVPALVIVGYITHFSYWHCFLIAFIGGTLGILFSIPLRRLFIQDKQLRFPEAQAIAHILQTGIKDKSRFRSLYMASFIGACIEFAQSGLQIAISHIQGFVTMGKSLIGFGVGFSATLIGAGYLMGLNIGISLFIGALIGYVVLMPVLTGHFHIVQAQDFINHQLRFIGIGSMLSAGIITLLLILKPLMTNIILSAKAVPEDKKDKKKVNNKSKKMSILGVFIGIMIFSVMTFFLLDNFLHFEIFSFSPVTATLATVFVILIIGFVFAIICGYFSGMVGVTASPGSSIVIGGLLLIAFGLRAILESRHIEFTHVLTVNACAIVIVMMAVITGIACIMNDNIQDLKVGQLVGSTPYKQQIMLFIGVIVASSVIPFLMQLLFKVYGLGGVFPHEGMDVSKMLPAPVPVALATVTQAVFDHQLPSGMLFVGAGVSVLFAFINIILRKNNITLQFSILGIAMGLYLPLASSTALFLGSLLAYFFYSKPGILNACGLVTGAALMDVLLAIPFAISGNPNLLNLLVFLPPSAKYMTFLLGIYTVLILINLFFKSKKSKKS